MDELLGQYASTVLLSYGVSLGLIAALVAQSFYRSRRVKHALEAFETKETGTPKRAADEENAE